ncbi:putative cytochrome P450 oxygenase [Aspergillus aculeatinus CBS 121060]|uniref:Cytochrome P450 oxygenase n=1 Tax=Aspergillus aculeatinus CBS 121060 TaxID=1448322 RepID=A0ACD1H8H4_9EURO|nr:putative cytochrome P450 oxygenase [Aspergillus aculeatinus CBS 121060]RAH69896.1 putative cytochrome P450 oxygenase [Aspergillus aculeatinus CBS 121060]
MDLVSMIDILTPIRGHVALSGTILLLVAFILRSIYRLYFDPLHHIPGPKLAAISHLYEFYYDVIRDGMFVWEIERMHQRYGPIVRINPREVHIKDPSFHDEIYAPATGMRDKDPKSVHIFSAPEAMVSTVGHHTHRMRRRILTSFFSRRAIEGIEPTIQASLQKFLNALTIAHREERVLELIDRLQALTGDLITQYAYGNSYELQAEENIGKGIVKVVQEGTDQIHLQRFFPLMGTLLRLIPSWFMARVFPARARVYDLLEGVREQSVAALESRSTVQEPGGAAKAITMFHALTDPEVPPEERTLQRLADEGLVLFAAGTETTATTLSVAIFHVLNDPAILSKLRSELKQIMPTPHHPVTWRQLEKLPYLTAVIHEALRFSGIVMRQQRISPIEVLRYKDCVIPPGTPVSTIAYFVHNDPTLFPDPDRFYPERWILAAERKDGLLRYLVTFGRGNRACLGMNLAYAEMYNVLATVIRRFDLELYETTREDVRFVRDKLLPRGRDGPWRVRVKVAGIVEE